MGSDPPIQCKLNALSRTERDRQQALIEKFRAAAGASRELPRGYLVDVRPGAMALTDLAEWIGLEARCCPFLEFALEVSPGGAPVRIRLTGGAGAKAFIGDEMAVGR